MIVPSFVFVRELTSPLSRAPRVSYSDEIETVGLHFLYLHDAVRVVIKETGVGGLLFLFSVFVFLGGSTANQEALLVVLFDFLPKHVVSVEFLLHFWRFKIVLFRNSACQVDQRLSH